MNLVEYDSVKHMNYFEYCDYLQKKYGIGLCDYMTDGWNKRAKVSRTGEGLYTHHKFENRAIMLSHKEYAQNHPREWQAAENLVYCDLLEHFLLHILICELSDDQKAIPEKDGIVVGKGGVTNYMIPELNDVYSGRVAKRAWEQRCHQQIYNDKDVYIALLKRYQQVTSCAATSFLKSAGDGYGSWSNRQNMMLYNEILASFHTDPKEIFEWFTWQIYFCLIKKGYQVDTGDTNYTFIAKKEGKKAYIKFLLHIDEDSKRKYKGKLLDKIKGSKRYLVSLDKSSSNLNGIICCNIWDFMDRNHWV